MTTMFHLQDNKGRYVTYDMRRGLSTTENKNLAYTFETADDAAKFRSAVERQFKYTALDIVSDSQPKLT